MERASLSTAELLKNPEFRDYLVANVTEEDRTKLAPFLRQRLLETDYEPWLQAMFSSYMTAPLAEHHHEMWRWLWALEPGVRPHALIAIINRGGAKSTTAEMAAAALGALGKRSYGWYVSRTQDQADDHVGNVGAMLESAEFSRTYPAMAEKLVGKHGNSQGWRRNRLRTASGFTIDALGLDSARRGGKLEEKRPDFIILDDIDKSEDSPKVTRRLISIITKSIIPSGSADVAILAIQNLIHANGVFARLVNGTADFLRRRTLVGPIPGVHDFAYEEVQVGHVTEYRITSGTPTWEGFSLERAESLLNEIGPKAFREEVQHEVDRVEGAKWVRAQLDAMRVPDHPDLVELFVGVDPSGGSEEHNDEQGIVIGGRGTDGIMYVLEDVTCKLQPNGWGGRAVSAYHRHEADAVLGERNYGGDMVENTIRAIDPTVNYEDVSASRGKVLRISPVAALCGDPDKPETWANSKIRLVGSFPELEEEMCTWSDDAGWSPNRLDSLAWVATRLLLEPAKKKGFVLV